MIINVLIALKKFVNADLYQMKEELFRCGSCDDIWFYKKNDENKVENIEIQNIQKYFKKKFYQKNIKKKQGLLTKNRL